MSFRIVSTRGEASTIEQTQDKLLGYPLAGVHVGNGRHVDMPSTWDGTGAVPPGWTSYRGSSMQHPSKQELAVPIDPDSIAALANGRKERLSAGEQTKMATDLAAAVELPADWTPAGAQATKGEEVGGRT